MAYLVFARKWRPTTFSEVVGQKSVTTTLENAISSGRIAHAYLFSGPRGVGKTTAARILAKSLNCRSGPTATPCNECAACKGIAKGADIDVLEIDGASNRGIDQVRDLRDSVKYVPAAGRYKVYIIDEVHMLTEPAFNALLKTLEEPPVHAVFVLATTELQKIPATIASRCQRFDFRRIAVPDIVQRLRLIADSEQIAVQDDVLWAIARKADGSMRDGESLLDQLISFSGDEVTAEAASEMLGLVDRDILFEMTGAILKRDGALALELVSSAVERGHDIKELSGGLVEHVRNLLVTATVSSPAGLIDVAGTYLEQYSEQAKQCSDADLLRLARLAAETDRLVQRSTLPRFELEVGILRMVKMDSTVVVDQVLDRLQQLEKQLSGTPQPAGLAKERGQPVVDPSKTQAVADRGHPTSSDEPELEQVRRQWSAIVERVKQRNVYLGSFLSEGVPTQLAADKLTILFHNSRRFHKERVDRKSYLSVVEEELEAVVGKSLRVQCTLDDSLAPPAQPDESKEPATDAADQLTAAVAKEPMLARLIEAFNCDLAPKSSRSPHRGRT